jgi:hypothetical protein
MAAARRLLHTIGRQAQRRSLTAAGLCIFVLSPTAFDRAALGQVIIVDATAATDYPLSSVAPTKFSIEVDVTVQDQSTLHLFVEEYPSGSGCDGSVHQTNGGADFEVSPVRSRRRFVIPWFGNLYPDGFLKFGAALNDDEPSFSSFCYRFSASEPPRSPPPSRPTPPSIHPPSGNPPPSQPAPPSGRLPPEVVRRISNEIIVRRRPPPEGAVLGCDAGGG